MVPRRSTDRSVDTDRQGGASTLFSAFVGAITGVVLSFIPLSTMLGGAVAGYLHRGTERDGLSVGAVSGLIMFAPFFLLLYLLLFVISFSGAPAFFSGIVLLVFVFAALYTIGAAMLGGLLGAYLARERNRKIPILDDL